MAKLALGNREEATHPDCLRAVLAEIVLTFLFVFAGVASAMAAGNWIDLLISCENKEVRGDLDLVWSRVWLIIREDVRGWRFDNGVDGGGVDARARRGSDGLRRASHLRRSYQSLMAHALRDFNDILKK